MIEKVQVGWWQAPSRSWFPPDTPPYFPPAGAPLPEHCPGPGHWQAPDGLWFPVETPPFHPESRSAGTDIIDRFRKRREKKVGDSADSEKSPEPTEPLEEPVQIVDELDKSVNDLEQAITRIEGMVERSKQNVADQVKALDRRSRPAQKQLTAAKNPDKAKESFGPVKLFEDQVVLNGRVHTLTPDLKVTVDSIGNLSHTCRHTVSRAAVLGPISVFAPKNTKHDDRELFLLFEADDWAVTVKVRKEHQLQARNLAQAANLAARQLDQVRTKRTALIAEATANLLQVVCQRDELEQALADLSTSFDEVGELDGPMARVQELVQSSGELKPRVTKRVHNVLSRAETEQLRPPAEIRQAIQELATGASRDTDPEGYLHYLELFVGTLQGKRTVRLSVRQVATNSVPPADNHTSPPTSVSDSEQGVESATSAFTEAALPSNESGDAQRDLGSDDVFEQIRRLGDLHASGLITDEQFDAKRQDLLDRL